MSIPDTRDFVPIVSRQSPSCAGNPICAFFMPAPVCAHRLPGCRLLGTIVRPSIIRKSPGRRALSPRRTALRALAPSGHAPYRSAPQARRGQIREERYRQIFRIRIPQMLWFLPDAKGRRRFANRPRFSRPSAARISGVDEGPSMVAALVPAIRKDRRRLRYAVLAAEHSPRGRPYAWWSHLYPLTCAAGTAWVAQPEPARAFVSGPRLTRPDGRTDPPPWFASVHRYRCRPTCRKLALRSRMRAPLQGPHLTEGRLPQSSGAATGE